MVITSGHIDLARLLVSPVLLEQTWPGASNEVLMLLQVLRLSAPSLAEALSIGVVVLLTPTAGQQPALVWLAHRTAVLKALALTAGGGAVEDPSTHRSRVERLEVVDMIVGGRAALKVAG